jgi:TolB protein
VHRDNGDDIYPCGWSPDGKRILVAFLRMGGPGSLATEIAFVSVPDGTVEVIKPTHDTNFSTISGMRLSPDGRYIAYHTTATDSSRQNDLFLLSYDGSRDFPLVEHPANDRSPAWTPDGKRVLFVSDRGGTPGYWMMDVVDGKPRGEPKLVKPDIGDIDKVLGFTNQGAYYYTLSISMGDIFLADLSPATGKIQGKPRVLVSRFTDKLEPAWSPNGKHLAFYRRTGPDSWAPGWRTLYIRSLETEEEREFSNDLILYGGVQWFPDGRSLLVSACRGERDFRIDYYRVDIETGEISLLMQRKDGSGSFWPGLSPDGKTIFFTYFKREPSDSYSGPGDCFLGSYQIATREEKELCHILPQDQRVRKSIAVSPDGRQLAFVVHEGSWPVTSVVKIISPEGGQPHELFRSPWPGFIPGNQGLAWTPDGRHLLVVRGSMETEIGELLRISVQGGETHEVSLTAKMLSSPCIHPDGRQLAFRAVSESANEIWVMENFLPDEKTEGKGGQQ